VVCGNGELEQEIRIKRLVLCLSWERVKIVDLGEREDQNRSLDLLIF